MRFLAFCIYVLSGRMVADLREEGKVADASQI